LDVTGVVNVKGGQGGNTNDVAGDRGGGGGGGRIACYCDTLVGYSPGDDLSAYYSVDGGAGGGGANAGSDDTFWLSIDNGVEFPYESQLVAEPAGLGLIGLALLGLRKRRR
jgi:hypothetical protein